VRSMSKLELPADVADKVVGMLKPRFRPMCVLIFKEGIEHSRASHQRTIIMKAGALSDDELSFLVGGKPMITWDQRKNSEFEGKSFGVDFIYKKEEKGMLELDLHVLKPMQDARMAAILLGFQYRPKTDGSIMDVMYRDAHRVMGDFA